MIKGFFVHYCHKLYHFRSNKTALLYFSLCFLLWMGKASKKHQEIKKKKKVLHRYISLHLVAIQVNYPLSLLSLSIPWVKVGTDLKDLPAYFLYRLPFTELSEEYRPSNQKNISFEDDCKDFYHSLQRYFYILWNGCFPVFGIWMASCPWHGSRWSTPLDNRVKKVKQWFLTYIRIKGFRS